MLYNIKSLTTHTLPPAISKKKKLKRNVLKRRNLKHINSDKDKSEQSKYGNYISAAWQFLNGQFWKNVISEKEDLNNDNPDKEQSEKGEFQKGQIWKSKPCKGTLKNETRYDEYGKDSSKR